MSKQTIKLLILNVAVLLVWLISVLIFTDFSSVGFSYKCGIIFAIIAVIVASISITMIRPETNINLIEINSIPVVTTYGYMVLALIINTFFVIANNMGNNRIPVAVNLILLVAFVAFRIFTNSYGEQVDSQVAEVTEKLSSYKDIRNLMGDLLNCVEDPDIKKAVVSLKQQVDFSGNLSNDNVYDIETMFISNIEGIIAKISAGSDKEDILNSIKEADGLWKKRNIKSTAR